MELVSLGSLPFTQHVIVCVEVTANNLRHANRNRPAFSRLAALVLRISRALDGLKTGKVLPTAVPTYGLLHQVRYALLDVHDVCAQYEDPVHSPGVVFTEVYNEQLRLGIAKLTVLAPALEEAGRVEPLNLVRVSDLHEQVSRFPEEAFSQGHTPHAHVRVLAQDLNCTVADPDDPFISAAMWGQWLKLDQLLLENREHANDIGSTYSLLHMAVLHQNRFAVAMLLGYNADIECGTSRPHIFPQGSTPLHLALHLGNAPVVRLLLAHRAKPIALDNENCEARTLSTNMVCVAVITNANDLFDRVQEATFFAYEGRFRKLHHLMSMFEIPLNVKHKADSRFFLTHQVAFGGCAETYGLLLEGGAAPLLRSLDGLLPSDIAKAENHDVVYALIASREDQYRLLNPDPVARSSLERLSSVRHREYPTTASPTRTKPPGSPTFRQANPRQGSLHTRPSTPPETRRQSPGIPPRQPSYTAEGALPRHGSVYEQGIGSRNASVDGAGIAAGSPDKRRGSGDAPRVHRSPLRNSISHAVTKIHDTFEANFKS